jgi:hypothetical protein
MLGLKWGGCDKIFSSILWCLNPTRTKCSSFSDKDFSVQFMSTYFLFVWKCISGCRAPQSPCFKSLVFQRRKGLTNSKIPKRCEKSVFNYISACIYNRKTKLSLKKDSVFPCISTRSFKRKKINVLKGPGPRNPCLKIKTIINWEKTKSGFLKLKFFKIFVLLDRFFGIFKENSPEVSYIFEKVYLNRLLRGLLGFIT